MKFFKLIFYDNWYNWGQYNWVTFIVRRDCSLVPLLNVLLCPILKRSLQMKDAFVFNMIFDGLYSWADYCTLIKYGKNVAVSNPVSNNVSLKILGRPLPSSGT